MMDKKSTIGLIIIGLILALWVFMSGPSKEQIANKRRVDDSINFAMNAQIAAEQIQNELKKTNNTPSTTNDTFKVALSNTVVSDSLKNVLKKNAWKDFYPAANGTDENVTIENEKIKVSISTKSGRVSSVILKEYFHPDKKSAIELFEKETSEQKVILNVYGDRVVCLDSMYFNADKKEVKVSGAGTQSIKLKLPLDAKGAFIEYVYTLKGNDYMLDYKVNFSNLDSILTPGAPMQLDWNMWLPSQELHVTKERQTASIYYQDNKESMDNLSPTKPVDSVVVTETDMKWVALKQQFFSAIIINNDNFEHGTNMREANFGLDPNSKSKKDTCYVKENNIHLYLNDPSSKKGYSLKYYFGPNDYSVMKSYDLGFEKMIPMGWNFFSYINKWIVVPIFSVFKSSTMSFGWVILILTLIIKLLLLPIGFMTYKSSAKMKVLKPETDALSEKFGADADKVKKQQETMALYRKAGVSPFSGCLPLVFQMFVLIALFNFFPAAIELRQKEFWWAPDLSTYDTVYNFGFSVWGYGDHISMFALLMFISTLGFTFYQQKMFPNQQASMPGMKFMMYLMPVIFLSFMNDYSAGLSWYYFVANIINIVQNIALKNFISDDKLRAEVDANMKKPQKKKGGFAKRLEDMAKERQKQLKR